MSQKLLKQPVRELSLGERMKMELIAALLHSPDVLFLDEPTIGLDVVAQHNIQQFLKFYQQKRQITILLTSHYMKDVAALCRRVVIIADGQIQYDGSLSGIIDRFSGYKIVTLQLADGQESAIGAVRTGAGVEPPKVRLRIERRQVPTMLAAILDQHAIVDVAVEDPPLEEYRIAAGVSLRWTRIARLCRGTAGPVLACLVDDLADRIGGAVGVPRRLRPRDADAVPADHHADLSVVGHLRLDRRRPGQATIVGYRSRTWWPTTC